MTTLAESTRTIRRDAVPSRSRIAFARGAGHAARWLLRTVAIVVPVFLFATFVTFALGTISGLSPAALKLGDSATTAQVAAVNAQFGLNQPLGTRYLDWLGGAVTGNFGDSWFNGLPVAPQIFERLGISISVAGFALIIGVTAGFALGLAATVRRGTWVDRLVTGLATVIATLPPFVVAIVLIIVFSVTLRWLPSAGYVDPTVNFGEWLTLITLPAIALSLDTVADLARQLRTGLVAAYDENYVTGAIARGFSLRRVLFVHVLRNGAGPALAVLGLRAPALLGGAVVTESIFGMEGFGRFTSESALRGDVPAVQGALVVGIVLVLGFNLVVNALLARLVPSSRRGV
jgi:peptide/nickel transport system permease protein